MSYGSLQRPALRRRESGGNVRKAGRGSPSLKTACSLSWPPTLNWKAHIAMSAAHISSQSERTRDEGVT